MRRTVEVTQGGRGPVLREHTRAREEQPTEGEEPVEQIPLELLPTLRTLRGYGRRMSGLGALKPIRALEDLLARLRPFAERDPGLAAVVGPAMVEAQALRMEATRDASGEQAEEA